MGVIPIRSELRCGLRPNGLRQDDFDAVASRAQALLRRKSGRPRPGSNLASDDIEDASIKPLVLLGHSSAPWAYWIRRGMTNKCDEHQCDASDYSTELIGVSECQHIGFPMNDLTQFRDCTARHLHGADTEMRRAGWFECSDTSLNRLHENVVWSMMGNFFDVPTDCPQRDERLGWTSDIQVFAPTANFLFDTTGMLSFWLRDLAIEQLDDGTVPWYVPVIPGHAMWTPIRLGAAWGDAAVMTPGISGWLRVTKRCWNVNGKVPVPGLISK